MFYLQASKISFTIQEIKNHHYCNSMLSSLNVLDIYYYRIGHGYSVDRLTIMMSKGKKLKNRLIEDSGLHVLYENTFNELADLPLF